MGLYWMFTPKQSWLGQELRSVYYFSGGGVDANVQNIVDYLRGAYANNLVAQLADDWSMYECDVRDVSSPGLPTVQYPFTAGALVGTGAGSNSPTQLAGLVTWKAPVAVPNKTRKYIGGLTANLLNASGKWGTSAVAAMEAFADEVLDIGSTITGVGLSSVHWVAAGTHVDGANIMTVRNVDATPSTQRRRKPGVGI